MQYYRCKCGKSEAHSSMGVYPCDKCSHCGSNLALSPSSHREPLDHDMVKVPVETDEGMKHLSRCKWCMRTYAQIEQMEKAREVEF